MYSLFSTFRRFKRHARIQAADEMAIDPLLQHMKEPRCGVKETIKSLVSNDIANEAYKGNDPN